MGRVFSTEDLRAGRVPRPQDFDAVREQAAGLLRFWPEIRAATFYGSTVLGTAGPRSDIDCLAFGSPDCRLGERRELQKFAESLGVPLSLHVHDGDLARTELSHVRLLGSHLKLLPAEAVIKGDPLGFLCQEVPYGLAFREYLSAKIRKLEEDLPYLYPEEPFFLKRLQRVLEAPVHVARKMLPLVCEPPVTDTKEAVSEAYAEAVDTLAGGLLAMNLLDRRYTECVEGRYLERNPVLHREIAHAAPLALDFVRCNASLLLKIWRP